MGSQDGKAAQWVGVGVREGEEAWVQGRGCRAEEGGEASSAGAHMHAIAATHLCSGQTLAGRYSPQAPYPAGWM